MPVNLANVKPDCREFVEVMEELLDEARQAGRLKRRADFYKNHPAYLDIRTGKVLRPPLRREVIRMTISLDLEVAEKNKLLVAAGYVPDEEDLQEDALDAALLTTQRVLHYLPLPAYAITRDGVIHRWNLLTPMLFGISNDEMLRIPEGERNVLRFIFDPGTPVYQRLTNGGREFRWWRYTAKLNIFRFKTDNFLSRNKEWYKQRKANLAHLPEFKAIWDMIDVDTGIEEVRKEMPEQMPFPEYVTHIYTPDGSTVKIRGLQMRVIDTEFPRIIAYIPDDHAGRQTFTKLGIPTPDNRWMLP